MDDHVHDGPLNEHMTAEGHERVEAVYRSESRRVLATLIRLLGDFEAAEEALHDAFATAVEQWLAKGSGQPRAWLVSTGRFKAIDGYAPARPIDESLSELANHLVTLSTANRGPDRRASLEDDRLRLIFTCCHPALQPTHRLR